MLFSDQELLKHSKMYSNFLIIKSLNLFNIKLFFMKLYSTFLSFLISSFIYCQDLKLPVDTIITSNHSTKIKNATVDYLASTGTQPVWNSKGEVIASLFYTYYKRTDVKNTNERPLVISFNGSFLFFLNLDKKLKNRSFILPLFNFRFYTSFIF